MPNDSLVPPPPPSTASKGMALLLMMELESAVKGMDQALVDLEKREEQVQRERQEQIIAEQSRVEQERLAAEQQAQVERERAEQARAERARAEQALLDQLDTDFQDWDRQAEEQRQRAEEQRAAEQQQREAAAARRAQEEENARKELIHELEAERREHQTEEMADRAREVVNKHAERGEAFEETSDTVLDIVDTVSDIALRGVGEVSLTPKIPIPAVADMALGAGVGYMEGVLSFAAAANLLLQQGTTYQQGHNYATAAAYAFSGAQSIVFSYTPWMAHVCTSMSAVAAAGALALPAAALSVAINLGVTARELYYAQKNCRFEGWLEERVKEWNFFQDKLVEEKQKLHVLLTHDQHNKKDINKTWDRVHYLEIVSAGLLNDIQARCWMNANDETYEHIKKQVAKMDNLDEKMPSKYFTKEGVQDFIKFKSVFKEQGTLNEATVDEMKAKPDYIKRNHDIKEKAFKDRNKLAWDVAGQAAVFTGCVLMAVAPYTGPAAPFVFAAGVAITTTVLVIRAINYFRKEDNRKEFADKIRSIFHTKTTEEKLEKQIDKAAKPVNAMLHGKHEDKLQVAKDKLLEVIEDSLFKYTGNTIALGVEKGVIVNDVMDKKLIAKWLEKFPDKIEERQAERLLQTVKDAYAVAQQKNPRHGGQDAANLKMLGEEIEKHNKKFEAHEQLTKEVHDVHAEALSAAPARPHDVLLSVGTTVTDAKAYILKNLDSLTSTNLETLAIERDRGHGRGKETTKLLHQYAALKHELEKVPNATDAYKISRVLSLTLEDMPTLRRRDSRAIVQALSGHPAASPDEFADKLTSLLAEKKMSLQDLPQPAVHALQFVHQAVLGGQQDLVKAVAAKMHTSTPEPPEPTPTLAGNRIR